MGLRGFSTSGLRPEPPAAASGDPFAPRRGRRGPLCGLGDRLLECSSSPFLNCEVPALSAGRLTGLGATRGFTTGC